MPKQFFTSLIIFIAFFSVGYYGHAQNMDSLITIQREADPQEKIYVHFDKNYYNPGETIWFKAYVFAGMDPSEASRNFYAELLDESGSIIDRKTAPVTGSSASGSFDLPEKLNKPLLYFRAYTVGMLNSDTAFVYLKPVSIIVPVVAVKATAKAITPPTIRFLPEGGDWVTGLNISMAFKVTGAKDMPVEATGFVKDNDGNKVADFATQLNGMGVFMISPLPGRTYTAVWKDETGKSYTTPMPPPKAQGIALQVKDDGTANKRFTIQRTDDAPEPEKMLHLVATMNQHLVFSANINLTAKKSTAALLPVKDLPTGILQLTLFDQNYKPLAERICFVNNHDYEFDADAFVPQKNMGKRGLNKGEIVITDTLAANLSISITDADLNESETYDDNIISHLLLTGDLRGKIVNPYYYFFSTSDSAAFHLDLVMLTHGWRRYNWPQVLAGKVPAKRWPENNYLSLDGQVAGSMAGGFAPGTTLTGIMKTMDSVTTIVNLPVSRKGKVFSDGMIFYDHAKFYFQFSDKKMQFDKSMLTVTNGLRNGYKIAAIDTGSKAEAMLLDADIIARNIKNNAAEQRMIALRNMKAVELQNVTVTAKAKTPLQKMEEKYVSGMFNGDGRGFDLTSDPSAMASQSVFQYLQGRVAGLQINAAQNPPTLSWRGSSPGLFLNEMQADAQQIGNTPMSDIAYIKVFSPGQTGVLSNSAGGAIVVYTKKGEDRKSDAKGLDYLQLTGYSPVKEFYAPDYATSAAMNDVGDQRTTLYWNPYVVLNKARKRFKFQFYNNDVTKRYRLVVEGINDEGKLFHVEKLIQ
ncbi:MAG: hypothetical protein V4722_21660 [Bacteroidota bacterium]